METCDGEIKVNSTRKNYQPFWICALVITLLFACMHGLGLRDYTSVLAGTLSGPEWTHMAGVVYIIVYVLWVGIVPILAIAGGLLWLEGCLNSTVEE